MKIAFAMAVVITVLLNALCMMPMAMAAPVPQEMPNAEQTMTPMVPLSRADCAHCPDHKDKREPASQFPSCAGLCLENATITHLSTVVTAGNQIIGALQPKTHIVVSDLQNGAIALLIAASPPRTLTAMVVLIL